MIVDIQRVGTINIIHSSMVMATIREILESPRGLDFERALCDYVRHQEWKLTSKFLYTGMIIPVHVLFTNIIFPGHTINHKAAAFVVVGATPGLFGSLVEDCRNINRAAFMYYNETIDPAFKCDSFRSWETTTTLTPI